MQKNKNHSVSPDADCPCNSGKTFKECCSPILIDHSLAKTPEILMRSRYTAFVVEDSAFLLRTWDISTRPSVINFSQNIIWLNLLIESACLPSPVDDSGSVAFQASFIEDNSVVIMKEKSFFLRKKGLWFYVNGELTTEKKPISLKSPCPCGSGKKFKRCCRQ